MNLLREPSPPPRPRGPRAAWQGGGEQQPPLHLPHLSPGDEDGGHHFLRSSQKKLSLTLTASLARESARLPGSKSTVLYPLSGDPDDLVGDGELSLVVALLWFSSGDPVDLAGDGEESLVAVVALFCWLSSKRDGSFSVVRNCESLDRWLTEGCSFSLEGSAALLKKMTLLLPCCAAAHLP